MKARDPWRDERVRASKPRPWTRRLVEWLLTWILTPMLFIGVVFVILAAVALINDRVYGDWKCMFANCVKVKP